MTGESVSKTIDEYISRDDWREHAKNYKPLIDTGRKLTPLEKYPKDLDFSKTIGNTTYVVKSHFNKMQTNVL